MIIPSRGRPEAVAKQGAAWLDTNAAHEADLIWAIDLDDPCHAEYMEELKAFQWMHVSSFKAWQPLVPKLNAMAVKVAQDYPIVGFMGDDHLPRTLDWHLAIEGLHTYTGTSIAYGKDGFQDIKLPTWWTMSSEIVQSLGRMVPADVQHMYCDNSVQVLGIESGCMRYMPQVMIEHMHPVAGKAKMDEGYARVNRAEQYERDKGQFLAWMADGKDRDVRIVRDLRGG